MTKHKQLGDLSGDKKYDAARANLGGEWRIPTVDECLELIEKCTWTWTTQNGKNGYKVTGKNGQSIFLPAAGYHYGDTFYGGGEYVYYWSSSPCESNTDDAYGLVFDEGRLCVNWYGRLYGRSVRPVLKD